MTSRKEPLPVIQGNDLFDLDIFEKYNKEKILPPTSITNKFDYDLVDEHSEFWLFRVPADFDTSLLNGKNISVGEGSFPLPLVTKDSNEQWELHSEQLNATSKSEMKELDLLLPIKAMDGAIALAPFGPSRAITLSRKIDVEIPIRKAKKLRDSPYVPPAQPKDMKLRFHPYGFFTSLDVSKEPTPQNKVPKKSSSRKSTAQEDGKAKEPSKKKKKEKSSDEVVNSAKPKSKKKKTEKSEQK
ncbi:hypothetical protein DSO57_1035142 [Entomophthora muscae]|uniref:Uncharacterized protein n=1 Tax=Entomophthora muscae TaxID=34485 RepID=A0ACC2RQI2_9FUNG|nr:hypothetical protein DSO57_1035142 [Entomophthora muscae]